MGHAVTSAGDDSQHDAIGAGVSRQRAVSPCSAFATLHVGTRDIYSRLHEENQKQVEMKGRNGDGYRIWKPLRIIRNSQVRSAEQRNTKHLPPCTAAARCARYAHPPQRTAWVLL